MLFAKLLMQFAEGSAGWYAVAIAGILLATVVPYLIGSLNFAIIFSHKMYHNDVRSYGSGNAGSTNMLRTYGKKAALATILCDMLKAVVGVLIGYLFLPFFPAGGAKLISGFFVILGHVFPIYFRFQGGKGVASTGIVILLSSPPTAGILFLLFVLIVVFTKYVSLGSVMAMLMYPFLYNRLESWFISMNLNNGTISEAEAAVRLQSVAVGTVMAICIAALVIFMHRKNIGRLRAGTESKLSFSKKKTEAQETSHSVEGGSGKDSL